MNDIIGDIHGYYQVLKDLLKKMGYKKLDGVFTHESRIPIFVGDIINKGPDTIKVLTMVRNMVENNAAKLILGNHELNWILHYYAHVVHPHIELKPKKGYSYFQSLYREFNFDSKIVKDWVEWLMTIPLIIETEELRVVHACWHTESIELIRTYSPDLTVNSKVIEEVFSGNIELTEALFLLTKGIEVVLPKHMPISKGKLTGASLLKIKWWKIKSNSYYHELAINPKNNFPNLEIPLKKSLINLKYSGKQKPLFMGHYNLNKPIRLMKKNIAILDFSNKNNFKIVAYRFHGEQELTEKHLVSK